MTELEPASWVTAKDNKEFNRLGRKAAMHFLMQTDKTLRPNMGAAVEAVSPYEDGSGGALEIGKAAYRCLRRLAGIKK